HESRMSAAPVHLLNVPLDGGSLNMLRVYALPEVAGPAVESRYFRMPRDPFELTPNCCASIVSACRRRRRWKDFPCIPSMAAYGFHQLPELQDEQAVWLEIAPLTPGCDHLNRH
ncbi:MAG TPA: hypothetical protein VF698_09725, partial [Thermoanaerobaculia bacterium]